MNQDFEKIISEEGYARLWNDGDYWYAIVRPTHLLHLCGYVGIPKSHPLYGRGYDDIEEIAVHGGLTFASESLYPFGDLKDLWWLGFDCAHSGDIVPGISHVCQDETYKNMDYVLEETRSLLRQLKEKE